jgi:uncharacterized membrane protein
MIRLDAFKKITAVFIAFIAAMILCRMLYSGSYRFIFLLWNLFLAWVPFRLSLLLDKCTLLKNWKTVLLLCCWLLFFPNALYVVTDLIHLQEETGIPVWYDVLLLFTAALTGLLYAFASLYKVEKFLHTHLKSATLAEQLAMLFIFAGSFGVYLGRFDRWNSWDIVTYPHYLLSDVARYFISPLHNYRIWLITIIFTAFFSLLYFAIKRLPGLIHEKKEL